MKRRKVGFAVLAAAAAGPALPQSPEPEVLRRLEPGRWELRDSADERVLRASVCLGDPMLLMQPQHGPAACGRSIVAADARSATVHYSCPSAGFGRTTIRFETPRLARIDSQGIHSGAPFAFRAEARRVGTCSASSR